MGNISSKYGASSSENFQVKGKGGSQLDPGPYIAIVKDNIDPMYMGTLTVMIPALMLEGNEGRLSELIKVRYMTPFYGTKSPNAVGDNPGDKTTYSEAPHSYGMWFTPPDIDTKVLVIFAEGEITQGFWIGCIPEPFLNNMVPGIAASGSAALPENDTSGATVSNIYGTNNVPAGEINRDLLSSADNSLIDQTPRPVHPFAQTLRKQGLTQDTVRGTTTSSARRETPSSVFGISTPGRIDPYTPTSKLGPADALRDVATTRQAGHTFVMDDGDTGGDNQLIRLRTASGHQILMNDTAGVVYIANGSGNVWMEFAQDGTVDIYSRLGYNLRSGGDINFHSEGNINMYANGNIKMKANQHLGEGDNLIKGIISMDGSVINQIASQGMNVSVDDGSYTLRASNDILSQAADGMQIHQSTGQFHLIGGQVHFNSIPAISDLITPLQRSGFNQPGGTGTNEIQIPDVTPLLKSATGILKVDRTIPGMSGMRVPTHEPWIWHSDYVVKFPKGTNIEDSNSPGTAGYQAQQNRQSTIPAIQLGQYEADLEDYLSQNISSPTDVAGIQRLTQQFTQNYTSTYGLNTNGPFAITSSTGGVSDVASKIVQNAKALFSGSSAQAAEVNLIQNQTFLNNNNGTITIAGNPQLAMASLYPGQYPGNVTAGALINKAISNVSNATGANQYFNPQAISQNLVNTGINKGISTGVDYATDYLKSTELYKMGAQYASEIQQQANVYIGQTFNVGDYSSAAIEQWYNQSTVGNVTTNTTLISTMTNSLGEKVLTTIGSAENFVSQLFDNTPFNDGWGLG